MIFKAVPALGDTARTIGNRAGDAVLGWNTQLIFRQQLHGTNAHVLRHFTQFIEAHAAKAPRTHALANATAACRRLFLRKRGGCVNRTGRSAMTDSAQRSGGGGSESRVYE